MQPDGDGWWNLPEGHYEVVMENMIRVGEREAGWVITRSTLNRNGVFLTSGLYDTGYNGVMAGMMHVTCGAFRVRRGTRIGQYLSFDAESLSDYKGSYGIGTADDANYGPVLEVRNPTINMKVLTLEEIAALPKTGLSWYQIKKINAAQKQVKINQKREAKENEARAREELRQREREAEEAIRRDAVQATITSVVIPGK